MAESGKSISRRKFISYASSASLVGLSRSPAVALFSTILGGMSQRAWAESLGISPRRFLQIFEPGGPSRYMYDNFLTPYSTANFQANPMAMTRFKEVGGRYVGGEYATVNLRGISCPFMWSQMVPSPGGTRPLADLLDNLLCIQGINTENGGHPVSTERHWLAPGASQSNGALSADASDAPFAAINVGGSGFIMRSTANKSYIQINGGGGNWLNTLLQPFQRGGTAQFQADRQTLKQAMDMLMPSLDAVARAGHPGADALIQNRNSALDLVERGFGDLNLVWDGLRLKYQDLVTRAIHTGNTLEGFNKLPIGAGGTEARGLYRTNDPARGNESPLALELSPDMRTAVMNSPGTSQVTGMYGLAEEFAFAEYVLRNNLSYSVVFAVGEIGPIFGNGTFVNISNDSHFVGFYPQLYLGVLRHRAIASCLLELIEQLKAAGIFNETLISVAGEFNRDPQLEMTGSDHGYNGKSNAFYCGAFNGPLILGNLATDTRPAPYGRLSWGAGGINPELKRQVLIPDMTVTLAHLLRVPAPFTAFQPLVTLNNAGLNPLIGKTLTVA